MATMTTEHRIEIDLNEDITPMTTKSWVTDDGIEIYLYTQNDLSIHKGDNFIRVTNINHVADAVRNLRTGKNTSSSNVQAQPKSLKEQIQLEKEIASNQWAAKSAELHRVRALIAKGESSVTPPSQIIAEMSFYSGQINAFDQALKLIG